MKNEEGEIMQLNDRPFGELVLDKMVSSWWSAFYFAFIAVLCWILTIMFFPIDPLWAVGSIGFLAFFSTIGAIDMFFVNNLKRKSPVWRFLHWLGL